MSRMANGTATEGVRRLASQPLALWIAFLVVHLVVGWLCLTGDGMGDVHWVYEPWAQLAAQGGSIVGVQTDWVYPFARDRPHHAAATSSGPRTTRAPG